MRLYTIDMTLVGLCMLIGFAIDYLPNFMHYILGLMFLLYMSASHSDMRSARKLKDVIEASRSDSAESPNAAN